MNQFSYGKTLLKVDNVSLNIGDTHILKNVSVEIRDVIRPNKTQGQVVGFLGPSGIGKTQLFRIMAGLRQPTSGSVTVEGVSVRPGMVGVVPQSYPLFEHRTIMSNLVLAGKMGGLDRQRASEIARTLLDRFRLSDCEDRYAAQLSGGQRQRAAIAQQLMTGAQFILMDEPFSGLDPIMKDEACAIIREVASLNELMTIVVVTHDIQAAVAVADTIWLMGRDYQNGTTIPGAYIKKQINLAEHGVAWTMHPNESVTGGIVSDIHREFANL